MKKALIKLGLVVILVVVAAMAAGAFYIDSIARKGIESGSTYALGVPTSLDKADVGLLSGEFSLAGLNVANPGGFTSPHFFALNNGSVSVSLGSLRKDVIELPSLTLNGISMNLERAGDKSNYKVILENLKRFESGGGPPGKKPAEGGKKFVIRNLEIRDINVHVNLLPAGGELTKVNVPIDVIQLKDVGSGGKSVQLSDLTGVILKTIMTVAVQKGGDLIPGDIAGELTKGLGELQNLGDQGITVLLGDGGVVQTFGKTAEQLGKTAEEGVMKIGDEAKKLGEGIGNIFGGDKKDDK